ncbi:MAG: OmpA family protein [Bdellovibrionales bacterium]
MVHSFFFILAVLLTLTTNTHAADDRQALQDNRGNVVRNTTGNCVRTVWENGDDVCAPAEPPPPKVVEAPPPSPPPPSPAPIKRTVISETERTVHFPFNKSALTDDARAQLDTLADTLKAAKDIKEARVVGTADRIGSTGYNDKLSQKRAEAVRDYLIARGYTNASVTKTRWVGKSQPTTQCPKKMAHKKLVKCLQNDRRVEIEIVYKTEVMTLRSGPAAPATAGSLPAIPAMPLR